MDFNEILARFNWQEIDGCPGRYLLPKGTNELTPSQFLEAEVVVLRFETDKARDKVLVVYFEGGGLLTYAKENGRYLHTLNTETGLARILDKLGISSTAPSEYSGG